MWLKLNKTLQKPLLSKSLLLLPMPLDCLMGRADLGMDLERGVLELNSVGRRRTQKSLKT
jgi:hypothetical protein